MKKLLLIAMLVSTFGFTFSQNSLVLFNQEGNQFYVVLNGIKQNSDPQTNVKITGLTSDSYKVKIIFADGQTPDLDKSIYYGDPNHEYVAEVKKDKKGAYKLGMVSYGPTATNSYQAANTINYTNTDAVSKSTETVGGTKNISTQQTTTTVTTSNTSNGGQNENENENENVNMNVNVGGVGMNVNVTIDEGTSGTVNSNTTHTTTTTTTTTTNGSQENLNTGNPNSSETSYGCYTSNTDINSVVSAVEAEGFADDKKMIAKQALKNKCINTDQTIVLIGAFSYEDDKLEMAKYCYDRCADKDNFYKVNSAFNFSDSKEELNKYIESK